MSKKTTYCIFLLGAFISSHSTYSYGSEHKPSPAIGGFLGLNTIPSARMDKIGTLRAGISNLDPYIHSFIGIQLAEPLSITLRQTAEASNILKDANRLYPGMDIKLRLMKETSHIPEISLGVQSAIGHKRMSGEYIALSKRYNDFDFTAGLGWGRFGTAGHLTNPLKGLSSHFTKERDYNSELPNEPTNWFTGEDIGIFAGLEYYLPYDGLSLKLDYGADRYTSEKQSFGYNAPAPWGVGLAYTYNDWVSAGLGMQGTDKVMGRLSIQSSPAKWPLKNISYERAQTFYKTRPKRSNTERIIHKAEQENIILSGVEISAPEKTIHAMLHLPDNVPAPQHIGRAARYIAANSAQDIEEISITLKNNALKGTTVTIMRADLERAINTKQSSPAEIWQNTLLTTDKNEEGSGSPFLSSKRIVPITLTLENQISLSEEDTGILYRSSIIADTKSSPFLGFFTGTSIRFNLADNLDNIASLRPKALLPVRSDIDEFTDQFIGIDRAYISYSHSITPQLHASASAGYLEEFYAGFGGEVLYRPIKSRFAIGAELWQAYRRNPYSKFNLELNGTQVTSGHANLWYDIPYHDATAKISVGRYLAGDTGFSIGLEKEFKNGAVLNGLVSLSNASDADLFGGTTHSYHSLNLTLPLGSIPYMPVGSSSRIKVAPFGRDSAQIIDKPINLYKMTESFTYDHIATYWDDILK